MMYDTSYLFDPTFFEPARFVTGFVWQGGRLATRSSMRMLTWRCCWMGSWYFVPGWVIGWMLGRQFCFSPIWASSNDVDYALYMRYVLLHLLIWLVCVVGVGLITELVHGLVQVARRLLLEEWLTDLFVAYRCCWILIECDLQQLCPIHASTWVHLQHRSQ